MTTEKPQAEPRTTRPTEPIAASVEDMRWLAGRWAGTHGADAIEEQWSEPAGSGMMGMFRATRDGAPRFYELLAIDTEGRGLVFRFRHFDRALVGWEERDAPLTLDLVQLDATDAVFLKRGSRRWMTYRHAAPDELAVSFAGEGAGGEHAAHQEFRFVRR